jgi:hypothetical protein
MALQVLKVLLVLQVWQVQRALKVQPGLLVVAFLP